MRGPDRKKRVVRRKCLIYGCRKTPTQRIETRYGPYPVCDAHAARIRAVGPEDADQRLREENYKGVKAEVGR
jgi:hypothetical protein